MPGSLGAFAFIFLLAFIIALVLTPLARHLGERWGLVAVPGGRRHHDRPVPRIGGLPVYLAFTAAVLVSQLLIVDPAQPIAYPAFQVPRFDPKETIRLVGLLGGGTFIFLFGLFDDWRELPPLPQYIAQLVAAAIAILFLIFIEYVNNPFSGQPTPTFNRWITIIVTLFWLGLMMNTVNWLDGVDGLAPGVVAIACIVLFVNAAFRLDPPQTSVALLPVALLGALLGFLPYNFAPARIHLGSGAYFLGFTLGALSIIGGAKMAAVLLVMGLPLLDVAWQIVSRLSRGQNPAHGDRGHLHFRLIDLGLSSRQIVIGYYIFSAVFGGLTLLISSRLYKLIALIVLVLLGVAGFILVIRYADRRVPPGEADPDTTCTPVPGSTDD